MFGGESIFSGLNFGGDIRFLPVIRILTLNYLLKIPQGEGNYNDKNVNNK